MPSLLNKALFKELVLMKYKRLAGLWCIALVSGTFWSSAAAPYTDMASVPDKTAVDYLYDTQCLTFAEGNEFKPADPVSRGDFARLLYNITPSLGAHDSAVRKDTADAALQAVSAAQIMQGDSNGDYRWAEPLTVAEAVTVLQRYIQYNRTDAPSYVSEYIGANAGGAGYVSRATAADIAFHTVKPDGRYIPHVAVEQQVMKILNDTYGSMLDFYDDGVLYWDNDTLVVGILGGTLPEVNRRIKREVAYKDAVVMKPVIMSKTDYALLMKKTTDIVIAMAGEKEFGGVLPDYKAEQIVLMTRQPLPANIRTVLDKEIGAGIVRAEDTLSVAARKKAVTPAVTTKRKPVTARNGRRHHHGESYSSLFDSPMSEAITRYQNELY